MTARVRILHSSSTRGAAAEIKKNKSSSARAATYIQPDARFLSRSAAVCKSVISQIDATLTTKQREDVEAVEKVMRSWCDTSKGKDKTMCYYMGVGDAEQGTSGGVKRDISSSLTRGINAKRLCA